MNYSMNNNDGFTLVEMATALVVGMILAIAVYSSYTVQKRAQTGQEQLAAIQQNIRASLIWIQREARNAGYKRGSGIADASCNRNGAGAKVPPRIHTATATSLGFSMDLDNDGTCATTGENVTYGLFTAGDGVQKLSRMAPTTNEAVSEEIEAIEFYYRLKDGTLTLAPTLAELADIHSVQVSVLARGNQRDPDFDNSLITYTPASGVAQNWGPYNDHIRRTLIISNINFRNIGK